MPSLWWQHSVATEDSISPQPAKSSYALWTTFIQSGPSSQKYPVWSLSLVFCVLWPAVGLLIGRNEAATDYWQAGYFILQDSFVSSLDTHTHTHTRYRSLSSLVNSLVDVTHRQTRHSHAHTYATRNTMPRYCKSDFHVFSPIYMKVRILIMLHSIRPAAWLCHYLSYIA